MTGRNFWGDYTEIKFPQLREGITAKYLIVGGGITGLSAAYFLLEQGEKDIVLIERGSVGSGATGHSAGMLVCDPETASWSTLVQHYGAHMAKLYWDAQANALMMVKKVVTEENIACDMMVQELLILGGNPLAQSHILKDIQAHKAMHVPVDMLTGEKLKEEISTGIYEIGERTKENISVNPLLLARGFAKYLARRGVRIYEDTQMISDTSSLAVTAHGEITFRYLIRCVGASEYSVDIEKCLTTIAVTRTLSEKELGRMRLQDRGMFEDKERRSYHYGKVTGDSRLLVGYGDIKITNKNRKEYVHQPHLRDIERFLERAFPDTNMPIEYSWSEVYALSNNDLPVVVVHGNEALVSGAGTQLASIAAVSYAVAALNNKKHPLDELFRI